MPTYTVTPDVIGDLIRRHEQERREQISADAAREAAVQGVGIVTGATPEAFGQLRDSVHPEDTAIVVDAPYAVAVELGARPHMPPYEPLLAWATRIGASDPAGLANYVQNKIWLEGSRPTLFVKGTLPRLAQLFQEIIERRLRG